VTIRPARRRNIVAFSEFSPRRAGAIRLLLADDHELVRNELARILEAEPDFEVVAQAADGRAAVELARQLRPDVVLMDVNMPELNGIEAARELTKELSDVHVIGLSMHDGDEVATAMLEAGASAYMTKGSPVESLLRKIRSCAHVTPRA
jgi:DNA-binding NarL/FixJ family response regulator